MCTVEKYVTVQEDILQYVWSVQEQDESPQVLHLEPRHKAEDLKASAVLLAIHLEV